MNSNTTATFNLPRWAQWLIVTSALIVILALMIEYWPPGVDFSTVFRPVSLKWLNGETRLFDAQSTGFFDLPWTLALTVPLSLPPLHVGQAILSVLSLIGLVVSIQIFRGSRRLPLFVIVFAVANLHTFDVLIRGQIDVLILVSIVFGWWAIQQERPMLLSVAFLLMSMKPLNATLVAGLFYVYTLRNWPLAYQLKIVSLPILSLIISGFVFGFDWPLRYISNYQATAPINYLATTFYANTLRYRKSLCAAPPSLPLCCRA